MGLTIIHRKQDIKGPASLLTFTLSLRDEAVEQPILHDIRIHPSIRIASPKYRGILHISDVIKTSRMFGSMDHERLYFMGTCGIDTKNNSKANLVSFPSPGFLMRLRNKS